MVYTVFPNSPPRMYAIAQHLGWLSPAPVGEHLSRFIARYPSVSDLSIASWDSAVAVEAAPVETDSR